MRLQLQHMQERLAFLAGGTDGDELTGIIMEKEEEIRQKDEKLKQAAKQNSQLAETIKKVEAKGRDIMDAYEQQKSKSRSLEVELDRALGNAGDLRNTVQNLTDKLHASQNLNAELRKTYLNLEASAANEVSVLKSEISELSQCVSKQLADIERRKIRENDLELSIQAKKTELETLEERKKEVASRARTMKLDLEKRLSTEQQKCASVEGKIKAMEEVLNTCRAKISEQTAQIHATTTRANTAEEKSLRLEKALEECSQRAENSQNSLTFSQQEVANLTEKVQTDLETIAKLEENVALLTNQLSTTTESLQGEIKSLQDKLKSVRHECETNMGAVIGQMRQMEKISEAMVEVLESDAQACSDKLAKTLSENATLTSKVKDLQRELTDKKRQLDVASKTEQRWVTRMEAEACELRQEIAKHRRNATESVRIMAENTELRAKVERQEAFLKRKMEQEKKDRYGRPVRSTTAPADEPYCDKENSEAPSAEPHSSLGMFSTPSSVHDGISLAKSHKSTADGARKFGTVSKIPTGKR